MPTFDIDALITEFGAKYKNNGQTLADIKKQLFQPSVTESFFRLIPHKEDYYSSVYATVAEVMQAFSIPFTPKGGVAFNPWKSKLGEFKIDDLMTPDNLRGSWLGFLVEIEKKDRSQWGIVKWYITQLLLPQNEEDMELKTSYWGWEKTGINAVPTVDGATFVREFADENTPTPANAAADGIRLQIIKMAQAGRAVVISTGAWDADDVLFCTQIEDAVAQIPEVLRMKLDYLFFADALVNRYIDGRREKYNKQYAQESDLLLVDKSKIRLQSLPSMLGSQKMWLTPPMNRVKPTHTDNSGVFDVQKAHRSVELLTDYKKVLTFDVPEFVVTNDLENAITAAEITAKY